MYGSTMLTGHVGAPERAMTTSLPCLNWSVLLWEMWILAMIASMEISQCLMCINLSKQRIPLKARRQAIAKQILANNGWLKASATIFLIIPFVIGFFFRTGLARVLFKPCSVSCTVGLFVGN